MSSHDRGAHGRDRGGARSLHHLVDLVEVLVVLCGDRLDGLVGELLLHPLGDLVDLTGFGQVGFVDEHEVRVGHLHLEELFLLLDEVLEPLDVTDADDVGLVLIDHREVYELLDLVRKGESCGLYDDNVGIDVPLDVLQR